MAFLGMPGPWADDNREPADVYTCKIGGLPDFPFPCNDLAPSNLLNCAACGSKLCHVAQVYAPISTADVKIEDRALFVFGCLVPECANNPLSWRALRVQRVESVTELCSVPAESNPLDAPSISGSQPHWLDDESDDENMDLEALGQALLQAGGLASQTKKQDTNRQSDTMVKTLPPIELSREVDLDTPVVPCFYVYTVEQPTCKDVTSICANYSALSIHPKQSENDDDNEKEESWEGEFYEYDKALTADRTYLKFKKQLDANPDQCFRYWYGGKPLIAAADTENPGLCMLCGSSLLYEMQLMPPLIYFLQEAADDCQKHSLRDWNWMTLLVYTCSRSCSSTFDEEKKSTTGDWAVAEEAIIVQFEKPLHESAQLSYFL